jgi:sulfite reductase alpha subunit
MAKQMHPTPMLDELESGPWPSFVTGLKRLAQDKDYVVDLLGHAGNLLPHPQGLLEGRHGRRVRLRRRRDSALHRSSRTPTATPVFPTPPSSTPCACMPPPGMHYTTDVLRKICDIWERARLRPDRLPRPVGDIMFQGAKTDNVQAAFDELNELGFDLGGAGPAVRTS